MAENLLVNSNPNLVAKGSHRAKRLKQERERMRSNEQALQAELKRLRNIEHLAWHVCESSIDNNEIFIDRADFEALANSLPEDHPFVSNKEEAQ